MDRYQLDTFLEELMLGLMVQLNSRVEITLTPEITDVTDCID